MQDSLAILLHVYNCQSRLESLVMGLLEVAADLTPAVELAIVDDGSSDATEELGWELAIRYVQVGYVRHPLRRGRRESVRTGLAETYGNFVLVWDADILGGIQQLARLWSQRCQGGLAGRGLAPGRVGAPWPTKAGRLGKKGWRRQLLCQGPWRSSTLSNPAGESGICLVARSQLVPTVGRTGCRPVARWSNQGGKHYRVDGWASVPGPAAPAVPRPESSETGRVESGPDKPTALDRLKQGARGL
ncbi:MAG: glycosyltransferase [Planctomycetales bacterium]|nr:glycosyltransferase [Planctomycetales bacterium]NIP68559.1 glycosyltransferase [Planctomycetales bacterium]